MRQYEEVRKEKSSIESDGSGLCLFLLMCLQNMYEFEGTEYIDEWYIWYNKRQLNDRSWIMVVCERRRGAYLICPSVIYTTVGKDRWRQG